MQLHLITRRIRNIPHFWTTCGWSDRVNNARKYSRDDARSALSRMQADGVDAMIVTWP